MMIELDTDWQVSYRGQPRFVLPCDTRVRDEIVERYAVLKGGVFFNGETICIDRILPGEHKIELTRGSFFDLILCNVIGKKCAKNPESLRPLLANDSAFANTLETIAENYLRAKGKAMASVSSPSDASSVNEYPPSVIPTSFSFEKLINSNLLPNALSVSVLLHDAEEHFLISTRSQSVALGKGLISVTCTGAVERQDLFPCPSAPELQATLRSCAARELAEETGIHLERSAFESTHLFAGAEKLQPVAIVNARCDTSFDSPAFRKALREKTDPSEIMRFEAVHARELETISSSAKANMTEASHFHFEQACKNTMLR